MSRSIDTVEKARQAGATEADIQLCWLWLAYVLGPGHPRARNLLRWYGADPITVWRSRNSEEFGRMLGGGARQQERLRDTEQALAVCRRRLDQCSRQGIAILPYGSPDYPRSLLDLPDPPMVLYCIGDPAWLNADSLVGMVGSRHPDEYGLWAASELGRQLARQGAVIVSGLATGLDGACHQAAVDEKAPTIGVQGVPIDKPYPKSTIELRRAAIEHGCVVGEYAPGEDGVGKKGFLLRNRLIAGLSRALVVVQAGEKSGTMSTVEHAERYGRKIYAVPAGMDRTLSRGSNLLIAQGRAELVMDGAGILRRMNGEKPAPPVRKPAPARPRAARKEAAAGTLERAVLDRLERGPASVEELSACCRAGTAELSALLMRLELDGAVGPLPGQRYISL